MDSVPSDTDTISSLTVAKAKALARRKGRLSLPGVSSLTVEVAEALAAFKGEALVLEGLTGISVDVARALARYKRHLYLDGLRVISDQVAEALAQHNFPTLSLNGLETLTKTAAECLSQYEGNLSLGMTTLSAALSESLARYEGCELHLPGLTSLSPAVAESIAKLGGSYLFLSGLKTISDAAAAILAKYKGDLYLDGLTSLSDAAAAGLAKHRGGLSIDGVKTLSDTAVASLSELDVEGGELLRLGLTSLSDTAAESLAKYKGDLSLDGLTSLSDPAAESLAKHARWLWLNSLTSLSDAAAESLAKHKGYLHLDGLTGLSGSAAGSLSKHEGNLSLRGLATLSDAAAESLAKYNGDLSVYGLASLSDAAVESLAKYKGDLHLDGLKSLSDSAAESLAKHEGYLSLDGLISLSDVAAESLAKHKGDLHLDGLTSLSDSAADSLAKHKGDLHFDGLAGLSDTAAESLAKHEGGLWLGLETLSDAAIESLAKHKKVFLKGMANLVSSERAAQLVEQNKGKPLSLDDLSILSAAAAENLAKHNGRLFLNGLKGLSDAAAESLAKHKEDLHLDGLTSLSDIAAECLAKHRGELHLDGLTRLSDAAAASLANHKGDLYLNGLTSLPDAAVEGLSKHKGWHLHLDGLMSLSDAAAESLGKHKKHLHLNGLTSLSDTAAESLSKHKGHLHLDGLTSLSDSAADSLSKHEGELSLRGLTRLSDAATESLSEHKKVALKDMAHLGSSRDVAQLIEQHKGGPLSLDGLTSLSDAAAESLAKHEGELHLDGLTSLSEAATESLAKHKGQLLLNGLTSVSDSAADSLSKHEGNLFLRGLTSLSDAAAESLAKHKGDLHLDGLTSLSEAAAESLAKHDGYLDLASMAHLASSHLAAQLVEHHKGISLNLNGLTSLSDAAAACLGKHKGHVDLNGLTSLSDAAAESFGRHEGYLSLDGLTSLSDAAAASLAKHKGRLDIDGLTGLSDAAIESLARHEGDLSLRGLKTLSAEAAESLSHHRGKLYLDALSTISDDAAAAIAKHRGFLSLTGLWSLSESARASLQDYHIELGGLREDRRTRKQLQGRSARRTIRIFISSTFRDFAAERDLLSKTVFPELRRLCRERHVELIDVDLRWGITAEEAEQGRVLPICLTEIDRARPFFLGLLGDRYGWVPSVDQYEASLLQEQPWLQEHAGGKSVTELEILHGVLNNPAMAGHAFFYFRDPAWSREQGGDFVSEEPGENRKLVALKQRIRESGFPVVENYASPEAVAALVQEHLWRMIDECFPKVDADDETHRERLRHLAYSNGRRESYFGGHRCFPQLDSHYASDSSRPVLISGAPYSGKTALLVNWLAHLRANHSEADIILHHTGAHDKAGDPAWVLTRIGKELVELLGRAFLEDTVFETIASEEGLDALNLVGMFALKKGELGRWLHCVGEWARKNGRRCVIAIDGLERLTSHLDLKWIPPKVPPNVMMVLSCRDGDVLEMARGHLDPLEIPVSTLLADEQAEFIQKYLGRYQKRLTPHQLQAVLSHPLAAHPCFLLGVAEELRLFGIHEQVDARLSVLLSPPPSKRAGEPATLDDIFEHILARLEDDLGAERVARVMTALWASRTGLHSHELLAVADVPALTWATIENNLGESLATPEGRCIEFAHEYIRKAVEDRYVIDDECRAAIHQRLADYFATSEVDARIARELPWHCQMARNPVMLQACLTSASVFSWLISQDRESLKAYWHWLDVDASAAYESACPEACPESACSDQAEEPGRDEAKVAEAQEMLKNRIKERLKSFSYREREIIKLRYGLGDGYSYTVAEIAQIFKEPTDHVRDVLDLAVLKLQARATAEESGTFIAESGANAERWEPSLGSLAGFLEECGYTNRFTAHLDQRRLQEAIRMVAPEEASRILHLRRRIAKGFEEGFGLSHVETLHATVKLAAALAEQNEFNEAEVAYRRALDGFERVLGDEHPDCMSIREGLADVLKGKRDFNDAASLLRRVHKARLHTLGSHHPATARVAEGLASLLLTQDVAMAEQLLREVLEYRDEALGPEHPDSVAVFEKLAVALALQRRGDDFQMLHRERLSLILKRGAELQAVHGDEHEDTLRALALGAEMLLAQGHSIEARTLGLRVFTRRRQKLGDEHPDTLSITRTLAKAFYESGDLSNAEVLYREIVDILRSNEGQAHQETLEAARDLAIVLRDQGDHEGAAKWLGRALKGFKKSLGSNHALTKEVAELHAECVDVLTPIPDGPPPSDPPGTITNSIGMRFVPIPAGEFLMGSPEEDTFGDPDEEFQHRVRITKPFLLGMHQVTQSQYEQVTGENPSHFEGTDLPVEHLSWEEARRFCELLSDLPEEQAAGRHYRLPTEAEWEYACRAGTTTPFNTGDALELQQARFATTSRTSPKPTAPVGSYPPNAWGLFDMHGNVWEWTSDWFSADYFRESPVDNPQGPATGTHHTLRGGSASVEAHECRSAIRGEASAVDGPEADTGNRYPLYGDFGIRVVCQQST